MAVEDRRGSLGEKFSFSDALIQAHQEAARRLIWELNRCHPDDTEKRRLIIDQLFGTVGSGLKIEVPFYCDFGRNIHFGNGIFVNANCSILDAATVTIGDRSMIGPGTIISTSWHPENPQERRKFDLVKPVKIGSDVVLGARVIVNPGTIIGNNSMIGAGSVVTRNIPDGVLAFGNPCKVIRPLRNTAK